MDEGYGTQSVCWFVCLSVTLGKAFLKKLLLENYLFCCIVLCIVLFVRTLSEEKAYNAKKAMTISHTRQNASVETNLLVTKRQDNKQTNCQHLS